jgi:hypothetical protein
MQIEALQSMFPTVDRAVVVAVLEAHTKDGSADSDAVMARATEDLLQLSDPDFTPEHPRQEHTVDSVSHVYCYLPYSVSGLPSSTPLLAHTVSAR